MWLFFQFISFLQCLFSLQWLCVCVLSPSLSQVYSLTGRDLPRTVREKLRKQKPSEFSNPNIKSDVKQKPFVASLFDKGDGSEGDTSAHSFRASTPLDLESTVSQEVKVNVSHGTTSPDTSLSPHFISRTYSPIRLSASSPESEASPPSHAPPKTIGRAISQGEQPKETVLNIQTVTSVSSGKQPVKNATPSAQPFRKPKESEGKERRKSSTIMARAAFWDSRINQGEVEDTNVTNEFPEMPENSFKE